MIITRVEPIPLRIPVKAGNTSDASAWGDSNLPAADSFGLILKPPSTAMRSGQSTAGFPYPRAQALELIPILTSSGSFGWRYERPLSRSGGGHQMTTERAVLKPAA
jgi:hypothetical protein